MSERNHQPYKISIIRSPTSTTEYFDNEFSPNHVEEKEEESDLNLVEEFKSSVSSFWAFNTDLFDLPPIVFDEEVVSWDKIIRENILQPFLPKNKLILQRLMKGLQEQDQHQSIAYESAIKRKSNLLAGDSGNADQIEKRLHEVKRKMEKKVKIISPKSPLNIGRRFEVNSLDRVDAFLNKRKILKREESNKDIVNKRFYDLNTSLKDLRKDIDFFKLYEPEAEPPVEEAKKFRTQRTPKLFEISSLKIITPSILNASQSKIEPPNSAKSASRLLLRKESLISKKHVRRKSCYCSQCGGLSMIEKHTVDICVHKETNKASELPIQPTTHSLQPESALLGGGRDKYSRSGPLRRESSHSSLTKIFLKDHPQNENDGNEHPKLPSIRTPKNHIDMMERRKSAFFTLEVNSPFKVHPKSRLHQNNSGTPKSNNESQTQNNPAGLLTVGSNTPKAAGTNGVPSVLDVSIDAHTAGGKSNEDAYKTSSRDEILHTEEREKRIEARKIPLNLKPLLTLSVKKDKPKKKKAQGQSQTHIDSSAQKLPTLVDKKASKKLARTLGIKTVQNSQLMSEPNEPDTLPKEKTLTEAFESQTKKTLERTTKPSHRRNFTVGSTSMLQLQQHQQLAVLSPKLLVQKKKQEMLEESMKRVTLHDKEEISKVYLKSNQQLVTPSVISQKTPISSPNSLGSKVFNFSPRTQFGSSPYLSPRSHYKNSLKHKDLKLSPISLNPTRIISSP